jgi:hypothetical protein
MTTSLAGSASAPRPARAAYESALSLPSSRRHTGRHKEGVR